MIEVANLDYRALRRRPKKPLRLAPTGCPLRGCSPYGALLVSRCDPGYCGLYLNYQPEPKPKEDESDAH